MPVTFRLCASASLLLAFAAVGNAQPSTEKAMASPPALPHVDEGECPFEGCVYREWTAREDVPLYDTWQGSRKQVGAIRKGEKVTAVGGLVVTTRPGTIHVDRDVPEAGLQRGDIILTYSFVSEGFADAWINGRFYKEFDVSITKWPNGMGCGGAHCAATYVDLGERVWWAQLKLASGQAGWIQMNADLFDGVNVLAEPPQPAAKDATADRR